MTEFNVYRMYDAHGVLLWVGFTGTVLSRLVTHSRTSAWFPAVRTITLEPHATLEAGVAAEEKAIAEEKPLHNIVGSLGHGYCPPSMYIPELRRNALRSALPAQIAVHKCAFLSGISELELWSAIARGRLKATKRHNITYVHIDSLEALTTACDVMVTQP